MTENKKLISKNKYYTYFWEIWSVLGVVIITILWAFGVYYLFKYVEVDVFNPGTFGDMFGGLSALFSGLAFAGLVITLRMQKQELVGNRLALESQIEEMKLQRKETRDTREEIKYQRKEIAFQQDLLSEQVKQSTKRDFEAYLFRLIDQWQGHIEGVFFKNGGNILTGKAALNQLLDATLGSVGEDMTRYESWRMKHKTDIVPYITQFQAIVTYITEEDIPEDDKRKYANMVRCYLTDNELLVILYNCNTEVGKPMKARVEELGILEGSYDEFNAKYPKLVGAMEPSAFGRS